MKKKKNKLNLGCDYAYKDRWINLDSHRDKGTRPDVIHNLNKFPYPFKDNTFHYILAAHVLEHLENPLKVMEELWRIGKPNATIELKIPYWTSYNAWVDLTHKRPFTYNSFSQLCGFFDDKGRGRVVGYQQVLFEYQYRKLIWGTTKKPILKHISKFMNWFVNLCPEFVERRIPFLIPIQSLHIKLKIKKWMK